MHEQEKLEEARHFLGEMAASVDKPTVFGFELSAFLAAARSALQYAQREAKSHGGQAWYDAHVAATPVVQFFRDQRDISIHVKPVIPAANLNIWITEVVRFSESWSVQVVDVDGNIIHEAEASSPAPPAADSSPRSISRSYTFADWFGPEDVLTLAKAYLDALDAVVKDGVDKGYLTAPA